MAVNRGCTYNVYFQWLPPELSTGHTYIPDLRVHTVSIAPQPIIYVFTKLETALDRLQKGIFLKSCSLRRASENQLSSLASAPARVYQYAL